ncbi:MAG TPA: NtaA/DmoA family FMN-dependent monooxygenase [Baekduia sp.]|nr:NtaA/DmoA family FMN-dependent monooxygenase [Baekduia sp.]
MNTCEPFKLGVFASFGPPSWQAPNNRLHGGDWWDGQVYVDLARRLEAAKLDFLFFEDTAAVSRAAGGSMAADLKFKVTAPKHDPWPLLPMLAQATEKIGLIATGSTTFYEPYQLARMVATVDNLTGGRIGWNIVTSYEDEAAQNYGMDAIPPHDERYARADEFVQVAQKLWGAWAPDAMIRDEASNTYTDPDKVRSVDHVGEFFKVRGPLNVIPSPQGSPVLVQAGASTQGRKFAGKHAEIVFAIGGDIENMQTTRADVRAQAVAAGRDPDDVKVLFAAWVQFLPDDHDPSKPLKLTDAQLQYEVAYWSAHTSVDLAQYPVHEPLPQEAGLDDPTHALDHFLDMSKQGHSIADVLSIMKYGTGENGYIGTPESVADHMISVMEEVGGDGFMLIGTDILTPEYLDKVTERLVPRLQAAGVVQTEYTGDTFRERLGGKSAVLG